jgi:branched-chain amino acid aminotransferase
MRSWTQIGQAMTDHMLYMDFSPERGWSAPEIRPYGPLNLDPACSCFHYCPNVFEGLKVPSLPPLAYQRIKDQRSNALALHRHIEDRMAPRVCSGRN